MWWREVLLIHSPSLYLPPWTGELQSNAILAFFPLQGRGYQNLIDRSHLYEPTWKSNENVIYFCIEMCPQILPSSDMKPELEWVLLCILNYKSCNLHKSDNSSQLMLKHFSSLQATPLKKKIEGQPLAPITLPSIHPVAWCTLGLLEEGSHISGWKIRLAVKSTAFHWDTSQTLYNRSSQPVFLLNQNSPYFIHSLCS